MTAVLLVAFYAVMAFALVFAWAKGGGAERVGAGLLLGFFLFRMALEPFVPSRFDVLNPLAFAQDLIGFAGFVWIGVRARRYWPLLAAALQLLSLSAHFARAVHVAVDPRVYAAMKTMPTFLVFVLLIIGTINYRSRSRARMQSGSSTRSSGRAMAASWQRPSPSCLARGSNISHSRSTTPTDDT